MARSLSCIFIGRRSFDYFVNMSMVEEISVNFRPAIRLNK